MFGYKILFHCRWLIIGIFLRLIVMPFFAHPDLCWINLGPAELTNNNVYNIYKYHGDEKNIHLFKYPPLAYFVLSINYFIFQKFIHPFDDELLKDYHSFSNWFANPKIFQSLFFIKIIYLLFDFLLLYCLLNFQISKKDSIIKYWTFSPLILYPVYMYAQFDILPTAVMMLAILFITKNKNYLGFLLLGIAGMLKHFPFVLTPILLCLANATLKEKFKLIVLCFLPYIFFSLPFLNTKSFIDDVFINSGGYLKNYLFISGYFFLFIIALLLKKNQQQKIEETAIIKISFATLAIYLIFSNLHPQFIVWITPFIILLCAQQKKFIYYYCLIVITFFIYIQNLGRNASWLLLIPLDIELQNLPSIKTIIEHFFKIQWLFPLMRWLFNLSLFYYFLLKLNPENKI